MKNKKSHVIKNQNSYIGRTYKVNDNDLPHSNGNSNKIVNFAVIEENGENLGGVRTTTQETKNARPFRTGHRLYKGFKTFLEIEFDNGDLITADDKRLTKNPWVNNLSNENVNEVRNQIYLHSKQSGTNKFRRDKLKSLNKKSRH